jgi:hypothetical protein
LPATLRIARKAGNRAIACGDISTLSIMNIHKKKLIAPVVITALIVFFISLQFWAIVKVFNNIDWHIALKITALVAPLAIAIALIAVLIERIKEIKKGEEDDLGKY